MPTSIQSKTFGSTLPRVRLAGSLCALALAAAGVTTLGLKSDVREAATGDVGKPHGARSISAVPMADVAPYTYLVSSQAESDAVYTSETEEHRVRAVLADSPEGRALIDSMAASWGTNANHQVIDLRR